MRISHHSDVFKIIRSDPKIHQFGAFDIETKQKRVKKNSEWMIENHFLLGGYYDERGYIYFKNRDRYIEFLLKQRDRTLVATNLSFDHLVLFHDTALWNRFKIIMRAGSLIIAKIKRSEKNYISFIDTSNYARLSVEDMGRIIGVDKLNHPSFLGKEPKNRSQWLELIRYCEYDCKITFGYMDHLQRIINDLGSELKITIASTAMNLYQRHHLPMTIIRDEAILKGANDHAYRSYYGGRVEAFKRGKLEKHHNLKIYDVNSMYPFIMKEYRVPYPESVFKPQILSVDNFRYEGVSTVKVSYTPKPDDEYYNYPLLPTRHEGKLVFPHGEWIATYTHVELRRAVELGYRFDVLDSTCYRKTWYAFGSYVETLYKKRMSATDGADKHVYKLLLNSLYGKFGSRRFTDTELFDYSAMGEDEREALVKEYFDPKNEVFGDVIDHGFVQKPTEAKAGYVIPIFASYISSRARILLHHYISTYQAWYCDTDSLITDKKIPCSSKLGDLKLEETINDGYIVKPKYYRTNQRFKIKGVSKIIERDGVESRINSTTFDEILLSGHVRFKRFTKLRESYKRGIRPNTIIPVEKELDPNDTKREWGEVWDPTTTQTSIPLIIHSDREEMPSQDNKVVSFQKNK